MNKPNQITIKESADSLYIFVNNRVYSWDHEETHEKVLTELFTDLQFKVKYEEDY